MPPPFPRGVYAILDLDRIAPLVPSAPGGERALLHGYAEAAVGAGAVALQIRAKSSPPTSLYLSRLLGELVDTYGARVPVLLNDHLPAALPFRGKPGLGVHVGQDDASPVTARHQLGEGAVVGLSTHSLEQVAAAAALPADYIGFGPVKATATKAGEAKGFDLLAEACAAASQRVVAIGGLGLDDIPAVRAAGAHAVAVVSAWLGTADDPSDPDQASLAMSMLVATWLSSPAPKRADA